MANGLWCGCVNDSVSRQSVNNARITVTDPATGNLLGLFADREATKPLGNPFLTREDGKIKFFVRAGRINVEAFKSGSSMTFENEVVVDDWTEVIPPLWDYNVSQLDDGYAPGDGLIYFGWGSLLGADAAEYTLPTGAIDNVVVDTYTLLGAVVAYGDLSLDPAYSLILTIDGFAPSTLIPSVDAEFFGTLLSADRLTWTYNSTHDITSFSWDTYDLGLPFAWRVGDAAGFNLAAPPDALF